MDGARMTDITPLKNLRNLEKVDLRGIPITRLPPWIVKWNSQLDLSKVFDGCPLQDPPMDIVKQGREAIRKYFANKGAIE